MSEEKKIVWIQNLRAIACVLIVLLHVIDGWLKSNSIQLTTYSNRWWIDNVLVQIFVQIAVPIFIMISGALLLNPKKDLNLKKIIKYMTKMILIIITFGFFYCLIEQFVHDKFSNPLGSIGNAILHVFENKSWGIMWYVYMLIGIYAITPLLKAFINTTDGKTFIFILSVLFVVSSFVPTINALFNIELTNFYLDGFIFIFYYMVGYFIAYRLKSFQNSKKIIYFLGIISLIVFLILLVLKNGYYTELNTNDNCFIAIWSMFVFYLFSNEIIKIKENRILNYIAKYSFGIFLVHTFWLNIINKGLNIYPDILPSGIGEVVFLIGIMAISVISCIVLYKLPFFKNILK